MAICECRNGRRSKHCEAHPGFTRKIKRGGKAEVKALGSYILDYSEVMRNQDKPCWFIGKGRVAGNTAPIPSGLHSTPRAAWRAAAIKLGVY